MGVPFDGRTMAGGSEEIKRKNKGIDETDTAAWGRGREEEGRREKVGDVGREIICVSCEIDGMKNAAPNDALHRHDLTDEMWAKIEPLLPGRRGCWGGIAQNNRRFVNAVLWIVRTCAPWRDLPAEYGGWSNTHRRFIRWRNAGVWEWLLEACIDEPDMEWLMVDATHVRFHPHAAGAVATSRTPLWKASKRPEWRRSFRLASTAKWRVLTTSTSTKCATWSKMRSFA